MKQFKVDFDSWSETKDKVEELERFNTVVHREYIKAGVQLSQSKMKMEDMTTGIDKLNMENERLTAALHAANSKSSRLAEDNRANIEIIHRLEDFEYKYHSVLLEIAKFREAAEDVERAKDEVAFLQRKANRTHEAATTLAVENDDLKKQLQRLREMKAYFFQRSLLPQESVLT
eukprot:TRINITY_DN68498_c0_g1_i1.p2 TRINITY_DN68498_c0_g1~~TRINITY_DN68498_c0_g1_i1.p2  ORF type:complete len:181 (-),score=34.55 TRINITY_DN68498_c0_g1_i1:834-1355(-)